MFADDDAGIFLGSRDVPSLIRSAFDADGSLTWHVALYAVAHDLPSLGCIQERLSMHHAVPAVPDTRLVVAALRLVVGRYCRWLTLLRAVDDRRRMSPSSRCRGPVVVPPDTRWTWNRVARRRSPSTTPHFLDCF